MFLSRTPAPSSRSSAAADKVQPHRGGGQPGAGAAGGSAPGGCSGLSYEMFFDTDVAAETCARYNGMVVDPASAHR